MPCRDYGDDGVADHTRAYQKQRDLLARIACNALTLLEKHHIKITDAETLEWWPKHKAADAAEQAQKAKLARAKRAAEIKEYKKLHAKYGGEH